MCGITGIVLQDPRSSPDRALLEHMTDSLAHRGPDDHAVRVDGPFGLGFRRLAVIDPEGGAQPIFNEERDVCVLLNGEVVNHRALRAELEARGHVFRTGSDAEVLVHLYEERGAALVDELAGMYAFAIVDRRRAPGRLLLARDRLGIKPLYWVHGPRGLAFASEPKALLELGWTPRELRPEALLDYLVQGYVGGRRSAWSGIQRLGPSQVLEWEPGSDPPLGPRVRRTWDLPLEPRAHGAQDADPGRLLAALDAAVEEHAHADVPLGAFLSGGIDSGAVATSLARAVGPPVLCTVGFEERSHDELELARRTAAGLEAVHHTRVLRPDPEDALARLPWFFDEPLADPSTLPTFLVSAMAREHVTVALSGDGGDELFAGYRRYRHDRAEHRVRRLLGPLAAPIGGLGRLYPRLQWAPRRLRGRTFLRNLGDDPARAYWRSVTQLERGEALALLAPDVSRRLDGHDPFETFGRHYARPRGMDALYRAQYADFHTELAEGILCKVDRASMAHGLEVRVPLLDHRLVERFAPLAPATKIRDGRGKALLRAALAHRLDDRVLAGPKRGFDTPLRPWIAGPLAGAVEDAIESLPEEWFRRDGLRRAHAQHRRGTRDHGRLLWSLLVLEHWRRTHGVRGLAS